MNQETDRPDFVYSLQRTGCPKAWELSGETLSVLRAAVDSVNRLPRQLFDRKSERVLLGFLCGDLLEAAVMRALEREPSGLWLHRSSGHHSSRMPLAGVTLRAFEALLYVAKLQIVRPMSDARDQLDGALLFVFGFSIDVIEADGIPF